MTSNPFADAHRAIERNFPSIHRYYVAAEAEAMQRMERAQAWAERAHSTVHARELAYRLLCAAEQAAIDATRDRTDFERRHPNFKAVR